MPKVSIIVPAYNAGGAIERCLESIRKQSFGDFEVICIDDGSTDDTGELLERFCARDSRFTCIRQDNAGAALARNAGLDRATGEFVMMVDADDVLPAHALRRMHQITVIHECDTVVGKYERVDGVTCYPNARSAHLVNKARRVQPDDLDIIHTWTMCNKWLSREIIERESLRLEPYRHLEDATFLYRYLPHAEKIYTCPHVVYTYIKPLPAVGRTSTQSVDGEMLDAAAAALERLRGLTAGFGERFARELDYRYLNSPLVGDYYRRLWVLDDAAAERVRSSAQAILDGLSDAHLERVLRANPDLLAGGRARSRDELAASPLVTVAVGESVSDEAAGRLIEGLYDQSFVAFRVLVAAGKERCAGERLRAMPNFEVAGGDAFEQARLASSPYVAFIDCDMVYDHRALMTMFKRLEANPQLDFVSLMPKEPRSFGAAPCAPIERAYGEGDPTCDRFLANKLFRASSLRDLPLDAAVLFDELEWELLTRPAMVSFMTDEDFDPSLAELREREGRERREKAAAAERERAERARRAANPARRAKRALRRLLKPAQAPAPAAPRPTIDDIAKLKRRRTIDFYLDEEIDEQLIVLEGLGKRPRGNMLYVLRELAAPEYAGYSIVFPVTNASRAESERVIAREGLRNVTCVTAGSDEYKQAVFTAKFLFNEVDFPNWWIKKPRQVYVNLWHGTPLKTLGKAKRGTVHNDANASRNFTMADYLLFPNEFTRRHLLGDCDVEGLAAGEALMLGYPRTGALFDAAVRMRAREALGLGEERAIAWMPTYREWFSAEDVAGFLGEMDALLDEGEVLLVNLHHKTAGELDLAAYERVRVFPDGLDTYEALAAVDALVTDYSSVMFDFAATGRAIVLFCPDLERYEADRGLYRDVRELPFPLAGTAAEVASALAAPARAYDAFRAEFNAFDGPDNARRLCEAVIGGRAEAAACERLETVRGGAALIVSDGIAPGAATDMLYGLARRGWPANTWLSFLEEGVDADATAAYPLVREVPLFATKGKQLSERTEQQRLYGDIDVRRVVVLDTLSPARIKVFARFDVPVFLFVTEALAAQFDPGADAPDEARELAEATLKALKLFARWGDGLFAPTRELADALEEAFGTEVGVLRDADALVDLVEGA